MNSSLQGFGGGGGGFLLADRVEVAPHPIYSLQKNQAAREQLEARSAC